MNQILKITDLSCGYKKGANILSGISLEVQQGEAVGIIGLNGSGKSTLGKAIMNMIPFRNGQIVFEGEDITSLTTHQLSHRGISIMQQGGRVFRSLSANDNLKIAQSNCPSGNLENLKALIPLIQDSKKKLRGKMADKLSGGEKHQLSLAMTLVTNPRLVILDEPSAGLSPIDVDIMYQILGAVKVQLGISIILIEQNIAKAMEFCDKVYLLEQEAVLQTNSDIPTETKSVLTIIK